MRKTPRDAVPRLGPAAPILNRLVSGFASERFVCATAARKPLAPSRLLEACLARMSSSADLRNTYRCPLGKKSWSAPRFRTPRVDNEYATITLEALHWKPDVPKSQKSSYVDMKHRLSERIHILPGRSANGCEQMRILYCVSNFPNPQYLHIWALETIKRCVKILLSE